MIRDKSKTEQKQAKLPKGVIAVAPPSFRRERALIKRGVWPVAGCDEAGRGPLAGPVVAAAVVLDPKRIPKGIDNSKRLTAERREELFEEICATSSFAVAFASPARIDRDNILRASLWALARAVGAARAATACVRRWPRPAATPCDCDAVIGGDGLVMSIAAASIIAKVTRDRLMRALALDCPGYGFETHKGYAVPEHLEALDRLGPSAHHRRFFAPVVAARAKHFPARGRTRPLYGRHISRFRDFHRHLTAVASVAGALYQRMGIECGRLPGGWGISGVSCVSPR